MGTDATTSAAGRIVDNQGGVVRGSPEMVDRRIALALTVFLAASTSACQLTPATNAPTPTNATPAPATNTPTAATDAPAVNTIAPPWTLHVADGNGNVYHCEHAVGDVPRFEYRPVTPATSSSGTYSGGAPRRGTLSATEVDTLWRQADAAVHDTTRHIANREKGTVAIAAKGPTTAEVIVSATGGAAIVATLAALPSTSP